MIHQTGSLLTACLLSLGFLVGCGGGATLPTVPVSGKVTLDGQPLAGASIMFYPITGNTNPAAATSDAQGTYKLAIGSIDGCLPGSYKVIVSHIVGNDGKPVPVKEGMDAEQMKMQGLAKEGLPATYSEYTATKLTAEVKAGQQNDIPLALKSDGS